MVVVAVPEDLVDVPDVAALLARGALVLFVNGVVGGAAGVCVQEDVLVLLVEAVEGLAPDGGPPAPVRVQAAQGVRVAEGCQAHAGKERVSDQQGEGAAVVDDLVRRRGRCHVHALGAARGAPLVHEAGVHRAHDQAKPGDDVLEALVSLVLGDGAVERAVRLGEVAQQQALRAGNAVAADVLLEVAGGLDHVT